MPGVAVEAGMFGVGVGILAIALASVALKRFNNESDKRGRGFAVAAIGGAAIATVIWLSALALAWLPAL